MVLSKITLWLFLYDTELWKIHIQHLHQSHAQPLYVTRWAQQDVHSTTCQSKLRLQEKANPILQQWFVELSRMLISRPASQKIKPWLNPNPHKICLPAVICHLWTMFGQRKNSKKYNYRYHITITIEIDSCGCHLVIELTQQSEVSSQQIQCHQLLFVIYK